VEEAVLFNATIVSFSFLRSLLIATFHEKVAKFAEFIEIHELFPPPTSLQSAVGS
jgi:hypothetical protein